ncbi:MAG: sulfotransferase domain-containing protein, partial [Bacteroidales bacterium]|nr:sulfotransferase domain-containing protein [Bacteroidales bacterium]
WHKNKNIPQDFLLIRYEDLYNNTLNELNKIINFLNLKDVSEKSKSNAINFASFNNMRKIEEKGGTRSDKLKPADINDTASYKTRKGKIGDYKNYFSEQEIKYLNKKMKNNLSSYFGYNTNL